MRTLLEAGGGAMNVPRHLWACRLALLAACAGCSQTPAAPTTRQERLAVLHGIAARCGFPDSVLKLDGDDDLHIQPAPDSSYESVDCLIKAVKEAGLPVKLGFVGNEAYETGNSQ
ncbi:MAG TPA: hypothetical protein VFQ67_06520 [Allosphingosinicella sp.]|jgi:hypothetical protein|nr:hypothetical protein [Allosphingosinicella sp.]